jgi:hypothetical protein
LQDRIAQGGGATSVYDIDVSWKMLDRVQKMTYDVDDSDKIAYKLAGGVIHDSALTDGISLTI